MADIFIFIVILSEQAKKDLRKIPKRIVKKFKLWIERVENDGLRETRKTKSYHDEPLQGNRFGQRSIRLNRAYRAFYIEKNNGFVELIEILEINKHAY